MCFGESLVVFEAGNAVALMLVEGNFYVFSTLNWIKVTLLQNKDLIVHPTQRIVCAYLLYDMYRTDAVTLNPFVSVLTNLVVGVSPRHLQASQPVYCFHCLFFFCFFASLYPRILHQCHTATWAKITTGLCRGWVRKRKTLSVSF